ncbi:DUF2277 family protein [Micromonospora sp. ATA51]|uniref:DUF2277 family protein n=1 Tax=Micromonospora sp. ATA51 TaxID=2806098 RepID=UPI001EE4463B|nr:DUF2277 family protein [Micromonospora sp. ATA51]
MCRSIKTLREPYVPVVTEEDVRAAALQYVRKISGFRTPAAHNAAAFDAAVDAVAAATATLLDQLVVRGQQPTAAPDAARPATGADPRTRAGRARLRPRLTRGRRSRGPTGSGGTATSPGSPGGPWCRAAGR